MKIDDLTPRLIYRFGPFELLPARFKFSVGNDVLHLEPRIFSLLHLLVSNQGKLVSKEMMLTEVWLDVEVGDSAITRAIKEIRRLLEKHSHIGIWIQTHYGQGYRFVVNVDVVEELDYDFKDLNIVRTGGGASFQSPKSQNPIVEKTKHNHIKNKIWLTTRFSKTLVFLLLIISLLTSIFYFSGPKETEFGSIAVLPIENISGETYLNYLTIGLTDLLIGKLAEIPGFKVISRTSMMTYSENHKSPSDIGKELMVKYLLEGSMLRQRDTILVNLRLIESQSEKLIWSKYFRKSTNETIELFIEVAEKTRSHVLADNRLLVTLTDSQSDYSVEHKTNSRTYELYLEGLYYLRIRRSINIIKAKALLLQAIQGDNNYAPAWAALAHAHIQLANYSAADFIDSLDKAKKALDRAMALDPNLAEAWSALGLYEFGYTYNWERSVKAYQNSLRLNPGNSSTLQWYAEVLAVTGEHERSLEAIQRAFEVDPLNPIVSAVWGICLSIAGEQEKAIEKYEFALSLNPKFFWIHQNISYAFDKLGNSEQALNHRLLEMKKAGVHSTEDLQRLMRLTKDNGIKGFWQWKLETLFEQKKKWFIPLTLIAEAYAGIDDYDNMLIWLKRAINEKGEYPQHFLMRSPEFSKFKERKEFRRVINELNLPLDKM